MLKAEGLVVRSCFGRMGRYEDNGTAGFEGGHAADDVREDPERDAGGDGGGGDNAGGAGVERDDEGAV